MNPGLAKQPRGSSSPQSAHSPESMERDRDRDRGRACDHEQEREEKRQKTSEDPSARPIPRPTSASPTRTILPLPTPSKGGPLPCTFPHPLVLIGGPSPTPLPSTSQPPIATAAVAAVALGQESRATATATPSTGWSSNWPVLSRRHDARSDSEPRSNRSDDEDTPGPDALVFSRDQNSRAPRSMMACERCRKQKMKCDGPSVNPCRGCKQAGVPCKFEHRNRPKSIPVLPSRAPPLFATFPAAGGALGSRQGPPGFYPSAGQPALPALSRPPPMGESYVVRPTSRGTHHRGSQSVSGIVTTLSPASASLPARAMTSPNNRPLSSSRAPAPQPLSLQAPPPFAVAPSSKPLGSPTLETRLRAVEGGLQDLASVPAALNSLHQAMMGLQNVIESHGDRVALSGGESELLEPLPVTWEDYRSRAWPLTPWLAGMRDSPGLSRMVVGYLGRLVTTDMSKASRAILYRADKAIRREVGRLVDSQADWSKEDISALSSYATWTNDTVLSALAVAQGRKSGLSALWGGGRDNLDRWRDWAHLVIMDHLNQILDALPPSTFEPLADEWKDLLVDTRTHGVPRTRKRDNQLLAWLDYAELLADVQRRQQTLRRLVYRDDAKVADSRACSGLSQLWAQNAPLWDQWALAVSARDDPILCVYFHYAVLFTTSPLFFARESVWNTMAAELEGKAVLEHARDAAFAVTQAICSTEIGRTLVHTYRFYRPILALALITLVNIRSISSSSTPLVNPTHVVDVLRSTYEGIMAVEPIGFQPGGIITGRLGMISGDPGRELWRLFLG